MTKKEVMERFCALSHDVMMERYDYMLSAGCFCGLGVDHITYQYDPEIMAFIENAVYRALDEFRSRRDEKIIEEVL